MTGHLGYWYNIGIGVILVDNWTSRYRYDIGMILVDDQTSLGIGMVLVTCGDRKERNPGTLTSGIE